MLSVPQARMVFLSPAFVTPQPTNTIVDALLRAVGVGAAIWLGGEVLRAVFSEPRDTYKYAYAHQGRFPHRGITNDLYRREQEHRVRWPGGTIRQVGRRVTRSSALAWERKHGF